MRLDRTTVSGWCSGALLLGLFCAVGQGQTGTQAKHASEPAHQDGTNELSLVVGRSVLLDTAAPVQRVAVGLGDFAEATVISPNEIMVNGKAPGETTLILWETGGNREFFNLTVHPSAVASVDHLEAVRRELRTELPGESLKLTQENGTVFLRGTVKDLTSSDRAVQIASVGGKVVNLLNVDVPGAAPQILLKVVFASVDRNRSKQLGINIFSTGLGNTIGRVTTGQFSPPELTSTGSGGAVSLSNELNLFAFFPGLDLGATIEALETKGLVQVLSEPNVLTEDGKMGTLLAGGEYPFPVIQGSSTGGATVTIMFKEYGVRLNFIPTITPRGTIQLQVAPEVSSLDFTNAVTVSGFQIPAIDVRRVKTEVELAQGQSFAIGGLLDNRTTETLSKIPYISNVPILGKFFQSISRTKTNTELIVIVTPEIVQPVPEGTIPKPHYPQDFLPPNSYTPMHQPAGVGNGQAAVTPATPAPNTMPVEKLIQSMKPEAPLTDANGYGGSSGGGSGTKQASPTAPQ
ncbi:MAG TPA: pilus assembly protein N-terminal domain-containing protein [Terracidiphilus sp.]|jgi:pilus assembly protein CpaC|nr:pilus assembly protein N-terminal domain-containing protein [Terracidiphilus sp.]